MRRTAGITVAGMLTAGTVALTPAVAHAECAAGLRAHLATVLPASNSIADGITAPFADPIRQRINTWIRGRQLSDSVIDFDAALRDPADPSILAAQYSGPDNLHPSPAGYQRMADAVDLSAFTSSHC